MASEQAVSKKARFLKGLNSPTLRQRKLDKKLLSSRRLHTKKQIMKSFHADLHCHSTFSDGTLSPSALAQRASRQGVSLWALTDHDEMGGLDEALTAAHAQGIDFLSGVEISVSFANTTVHIVGLGCDHHHPLLRQGLHSMRHNRGPRAQEMGRQLAQAGIANAYEGALKYVGNPALISRTHFARYLVEAGYCKDTYDVFKNYLVEGKPGYVPQQWASLQDAVDWITQAQGVAVIAHPARYNFSPTQEYAFFSSFKTYGGQAVEAVTGSHSPHEYTRYADLAKEFGFAISRGSDFHCPQESQVDLGELPKDPPGHTGVWELLAHRIQKAPSGQKH